MWVMGISYILEKRRRASRAKGLSEDPSAEGAEEGEVIREGVSKAD